MNYQNPLVAEAAEKLREKVKSLDKKSDILKDPELKSLYAELPKLPEEQRAGFGKELNELKAELLELSETGEANNEQLPPIDVTAPFDVNTPVDVHPKTLGSLLGSQHPLMREFDEVVNIFSKMGFAAVESREIDDDYHMFESLNFPADHPARDDYDSFVTTEGLIAPAHTSTMQNRVLKAGKAKLENGQPIAAVIPGRVFRNEDIDATHEHTFYQVEGIYVDKGTHAGHLVATLKTFLETYFGETLEVKTQPFYFPFTEPSFEFAIKRPGRDWLELLGCGMIHPNVLKMAEINPNEYTGFAWGFGLDRLVLMKYGIEDIRYFESGRLEFLRQFGGLV